MPETLSAQDADRLALALFEGAGALSVAQKQTWLARDGATGASVLVKRLRSNAPKARVTHALGLAHPNIVRMRRWLTVGGHVYVVRDVIRGRNLKQQLAGVSFKHSADLLEKLILPVLAALEVAHGKGVAHGGISAENVLIADDGRVLVSDFAVSDPASSTNAPVYGGTASTAGDIKAAGRLITNYLPTGGAFAADAVRARVTGILERCSSLNDLRETLIALDTLANAPLPQAKPAGEAVKPPEWIGPPPLPEDPEVPTEAGTVSIDEPATTPEGWVKRTPTAGPVETPVRLGGARLSWRSTEPNGVQISSGGGGPATLILTNDGDVTLAVRMVATQRSWLHVRPTELPIRLPPGASGPVEFSISAVRLSPGEYRSEVYLSANAGGKNAEDLRSGWFKHTAELRIVVVGALPRKGEKPPYPANAPTIPAPPGCALLFLFGAGSLASGLLWGLRLLIT
ncbi:MAG: protein kinase [Akkermansiaceae bacterium]|nr:protein kinase [Armatimonadota bacterium]